MPRLTAVGVFLDASNIGLAAKNHFRHPPDFRKILRAAQGKDHLAMARAYVGVLGEIDKWKKACESVGFEVHMKAPHTYVDGSRKADCDMEIALDIMQWAPNLDVIALISGDGDFIPLIQRLQKKGKRVRVLAVERSCHGELPSVANEFIPITGDMVYTKKGMSMDRPLKSMPGFNKAARKIRSGIRAGEQRT